MFSCTYIVERIDWDYVLLKQADETDPQAESKIVDRALLPPEIMEWTKLLYEYLQYSIVE